MLKSCSFCKRLVSRPSDIMSEKFICIECEDIINSTYNIEESESSLDYHQIEKDYDKDFGQWDE